MTINIFEGARRITKLIAVLWVGGWVIAAFNVSPSISASRVDSASLSRALPDNDLPENVTTNMPQANDPRQELIALRRMAELEDKAAKFPADKSSAGRDYSAELFGDTKAPETQPQIDKSKIKWDSPQSDEEWIDGQWWLLFMKEIGWGALGAVGGLLFLLAFTWTTGWIVRGFMGIPRGQDHRVN